MIHLIPIIPSLIGLICWLVLIIYVIDAYLYIINIVDYGYLLHRKLLKNPLFLNGFYMQLKKEKYRHKHA